MSKNKKQIWLIKVISAIKLLITNRDIFIVRLLYYVGSDRQFIRYWFKNKMGYFPNLDNPKTYNEKLQWLKLYYHNPILTTLVDKYTVKKYVADKIGNEYIIPTLGVWKSFDEIDFDSLPNQFVLKCTHDSGGIVICKDKSKLNKEAAKRKIEQSLKTDFYKQGREWPYKNVPRRIIAEEYMEEITKPDTKNLTVFRFLCLNGDPYYCQVDIKESNDSKNLIYDIDLKEQGFDINNYIVRQNLNGAEQVSNFQKFIDISKQISNGIPISRIDLYILNCSEYYGELILLEDAHISPIEKNTNAAKFSEIINLQGTPKGSYRCIVNNDRIQIIPAVGELRDRVFSFMYPN